MGGRGRESDVNIIHNTRHEEVGKLSFPRRLPIHQLRWTRVVGRSGRRFWVAGIGRGKVERIAGWTSCHDDRVAPSVRWLMKSLFGCLSNQMAELRSQHEQERTRLQQQHSAEKDSLVQEHQREVDILEKQVRATLQQHQEQSQEWRKCDAQVGGLHSSMFVHRQDDPPRSRRLPFCVSSIDVIAGVSKAQQVIRLFFFIASFNWDVGDHICAKCGRYFNSILDSVKNKSARRRQTKSLFKKRKKRNGKL